MNQKASQHLIRFIVISRRRATDSSPPFEADIIGWYGDKLFWTEPLTGSYLLEILSMAVRTGRSLFKYYRTIRNANSASSSRM